MGGPIYRLILDHRLTRTIAINPAVLGDSGNQYSIMNCCPFWVRDGGSLVKRNQFGQIIDEILV